MTTVFSNRFPIHPSISAPQESDWQRVRAGVEGLRNDVSDEVHARIEGAKKDGRISAAEYFTKDAFCVGGSAIGKSDATIVGAMKSDVNVGRLRSGRIDTFDVSAMRQALADRSLVLDDTVRADMTEKVSEHDARLARGDVLTGTHVDKEGVIHELTEGRVDVDYETFLARMNPADWSVNLPRYKGGEVRELSRTTRPDGVTEVRQQERMSLDGFPNNLDMTKNSIVEVGSAGSRVSWHVFHSDPTLLTAGTRSVLRDDGYIEFNKTPDGKVLVRSHSAHQISTPGTQLARFALGKRLTDEITGQAGLGGYFAEMVRRYRAIGEGTVAAVKTDRH